MLKVERFTKQVLSLGAVNVATREEAQAVATAIHGAGSVLIYGEDGLIAGSTSDDDSAIDWED